MSNDNITKIKPNSFKRLYLLALLLGLFSFLSYFFYQLITELFSLPREMWVYYVLVFIFIGVLLLLIFTFIFDRVLLRINSGSSEIRKRLFIIFISIIVIYISFFIYGRYAIIPRNTALSIINEANSLINSNPDPKNLSEEITQLKKFVYLYEQANNINFKQYPILVDYSILEGYIQDKYKLSKEMLDYDESVYSGKFNVTQAEFKQNITHFIDRHNELLNKYSSYDRIHLWMRLVFLR